MTEDRGLVDMDEPTCIGVLRDGIGQTIGRTIGGAVDGIIE